MSAEVLVPADAELAVVTELLSRLPGLGYDVPVGTKIPKSRPAEFVRVYRTGGVSPDITSDAFQVTVEAYAERETGAERLCAFALAALQAAGRDGAMGSATCRRVETFSVPANLPDPQVTDRHRYSSLISVVLRRTAA